MQTLINKIENKDLRKSLRNHSTAAEAVLWRILKGKQLEGLKFRRQQGIGPYIVDFYCPKLKLAIELDGEGYFAVARDEQRPFTVKTGKYDIQVLGTEFRVFAYSKRAEQFETCLVKGKVKVCSTEDEKEVVYLSPNEKVRLVNRRLVKSDSDLSEAEYTRQGIFSFRMKSLREILDYLNLWYGVDFTIQAPLDAEKRISGKFHQNSEVTIVLDALREIYDFNYREDNENSYVIYK